jgi:hypothetical protein
LLNFHHARRIIKGKLLIASLEWEGHEKFKTVAGKDEKTSTNVSGPAK